MRLCPTARATLHAAVGILALLLFFTLSPGALASQHGAAKHRHTHHQHHRAIYWGAWVGDQLTGIAPPWDMSAATRFEELVGKGMSLLEFSTPFESCERSPCSFYKFPSRAMESIRQHGSIPVLSWASEAVPRDSSTQPDFQLSDVIAGRYDSYIREFASEAAAWGHPFFLRFDWEMNGNWFPWSESVNGNGPGQFVAAWRHVHDIFASVGATNATWAWCPFADPNGRFQRLYQVYPGDAYVDWACMDGYNWGLNGVNSQPWRSFGQIFDRTYGEVKKVAPSKPIMLAEVGSTPNGGHKALWIRNAFARLPRKYPRIRGLIWFDSLDRGINWPVETSGTALRAFARGIGNEIYAQNHFAELSASPIPPPR
jgi:mannan endo-1,4-beta-mannosidase